jgi:putative transposase
VRAFRLGRRALRQVATIVTPIIPLGERHFRRAVHEFVAHYHLERNHQGLGNALIDRVAAHTVGTIRRRPRLGGLLNYYERAA